jgi:hypothetical protein
MLRHPTQALGIGGDPSDVMLIVQSCVVRRSVVPGKMFKLLIGNRQLLSNCDYF